MDGFIADKNGTTDWLHDPDYEIENADFGYGDLMARIDTVIMGNKTMETVLSFDIPYPYPDKKSYILTRAIAGKSNPHVEYVEDGIQLMEKLQSEEGKDIWLIGGGQVNTLYLDNNMIDEVILTIIPCTLGEGTSLFPNSEGLRKFSLVKSEPFPNGMVMLTYVLK
jgi:dihydrofolate reductase